MKWAFREDERNRDLSAVLDEVSFFYYRQWRHLVAEIRVIGMTNWHLIDESSIFLRELWLMDKLILNKNKWKTWIRLNL